MGCWRWSVMRHGRPNSPLGLQMIEGSCQVRSGHHFKKSDSIYSVSEFLYQPYSNFILIIDPRSPGSESTSTKTCCSMSPRSSSSSVSFSSCHTSRSKSPGNSSHGSASSDDLNDTLGTAKMGTYNLAGRSASTLQTTTETRSSTTAFSGTAAMTPRATPENTKCSGQSSDEPVGSARLRSRTIEKTRDRKTIVPLLSTWTGLGPSDGNLPNEIAARSTSYKQNGKNTPLFRSTASLASLAILRPSRTIEGCDERERAAPGLPCVCVCVIRTGRSHGWNEGAPAPGMHRWVVVEPSRAGWRAQGCVDK